GIKDHHLVGIAGRDIVPTIYLAEDDPKILAVQCPGPSFLYIPVYGAVYVRHHYDDIKYGCLYKFLPGGSRYTTSPSARSFFHTRVVSIPPVSNSTDAS